jgi:hypothetical protein
VATTESVESEAINSWYSGKRRARRDVQAVLGPDAYLSRDTPSKDTLLWEEWGLAMPQALIAASTAICVAVLGALLSYIYNRRLQRRQARLARLDAQLQQFYGPLYAMFQAQHKAHVRFVNVLRPGHSSLFAPGVKPLNEEELRLWRLWAESSHRHQSSPAYEVIIHKAHLLIEDEVPSCLLEFCAHKAGYDVVIERWKQHDFTEHLSVVRHPGDALHNYLQQSFTRLKREQARELEATQGEIKPR